MSISYGKMISATILYLLVSSVQYVQSVTRILLRMICQKNCNLRCLFVFEYILSPVATTENY